MDLRTTIISVGLPIIVDGDDVYRGEKVIIEPQTGNVGEASARGWVDVREANILMWIRRAQRMVEQADARVRGSDSGTDWFAIEPEQAISPPKFATWIFRFEDGGERIKR